VTAVASALYRPAGSLADGDWSVVLTPESAGWQYSGLRAAMLPARGRVGFETAGDEVIVLPLGGAFEVTADGRSYHLEGRESFWAAPSDFLYEIGRASCRERV